MQTSKYIPILFSTPMVQAEQEGRKTETRRTRGLKAINKTPDDWQFTGFVFNAKADLCAVFQNIKNPTQQQTIKCPYGKTAAVLWVRETWAHFSKAKNLYAYKADEVIPAKMLNVKSFKWIPSIHMPKAACRTFLQIQDIQVQRLQDITEAEAIAEGIERTDGVTCYKNYLHPENYYFGNKAAKSSYKSLWQLINGPTSWQANPYVWVIKFKRIPKPAQFLITNS